ncbi:MAG: ARMT1-like domain-containing protein [Thermodesulfobacteriota bacterium]
MLLTPDCIMCNYKASLAAVRELTSDEDMVREIMISVLQVPAMRGLDWSRTSPEVFEVIFRKIVAAFGNRDPFRAWKEMQNEKGLQLYPRVKPMVQSSPDPLVTALKLAIAGNSLDVMWSEGSVDVEPHIKSCLERVFPEETVTRFGDRIGKSRLIAYLTDNCGEIAFDKLFIEVIRQSFPAEVVVVVRNEPILNDATMEDARTIGLPEVATVIGNGIDGPLPGTIVQRCSGEVQRLLNDADLIISKGGGNFDSLSEATRLSEKICYMLMCKCLPYQRSFGVPMFEPILSVGLCPNISQ